MVSSPVLKKTLSIPSNLRQATNQVKERPVAPDAAPEEEVKSVEEVASHISAPLEKRTVEAVLEDIMMDYKAAHKNMEVAVMRQPFEIREEAIHFLLAGELQRDIFLKCKPELTGLFRKKLLHARLDITYEIKEEAQDQSKNLYTSSDKLRYLLEKSPALKELKKRFELETDF